MKENEAIKILKGDSCYECAQGTNSPVNCEYGKCRVAEATRVAIKALEEVQRYRSIGTPEKCQAAMEKQTARKVFLFTYNERSVLNYGCPVCSRRIISKVDGEWCGGVFSEYCYGCGQKLDWSDVNGKTD